MLAFFKAPMLSSLMPPAAWRACSSAVAARVEL